MKKKKWGRILSIGFILLSMLIVVLIAFNNPELMNAWDVLFTLDKRWLLLCLLAMVGYVYAEGAGLCTFLRMEGYKVSLNTATHFSSRAFIMRMSRPARPAVSRCRFT